MRSVLVVEDEFLIRFMLSDYLTECGYRVMEASSADDAIQLLETSHDDIDVVFSDVNMPGSTDGFGLARWVRTYRPETPVLLASGVARKSHAAEEGFPPDDLVEKPYDLERIAERIESLAQTAH
jgi:CheY-like chemotaxis protein